MQIDPLVHMANRIGEFFQAMPDRDEARCEIALHLRRFWEPRMRRALLEHANGGGTGLTGLVRDALREHHEALMPSSPA